METSSRKRAATDEGLSERKKRVRRLQDPHSTQTSAENTDSTVAKTPLLAGSKRDSAEIQDDDGGVAKTAIDSRALYDDNKTEIDAWYDEQYSLKLGIPKYNKGMHSNDRWFTKVAAWMVHKGLAQPTPKKRKLRSETVASGLSDAQESRPTRPDRMKFPGDRVAVPDYPFDKLTDFEPMQNGRYPCGHIDRTPPANCCVNGLTKTAKGNAIRRSIIAWKQKVERLIDARKLNGKHKTWKDWILPHLRQKHQPELYQKQQDQRKERQQQVEVPTTIEAVQTATQPVQAHMPVLQTPTKKDYLPTWSPIPDSRGSITHHPSQLLTPIQDQSSLEHRDRFQPSRVGAAVQQRSISVPQPALPSYSVGTKDRLQNFPHAVPPRLPNLVPHKLSLPPAQQFNYDWVEQTNTARSKSSQVHPKIAVPLEIWDHEKIDGELTRILATHPVYSAIPATLAINWNNLESTSLRIEEIYSSSSPQRFATRDVIHGHETQNELEQAYTASLPTWQSGLEDESLLQHTVEDLGEDWEQYCRFFANESNMSKQTRHVDETGAGDFDFGEPLTAEELATLDFGDWI